MGESTCLMQPFSYTAGISNDAKEGNPIQGLGQSISFGRFVSESLAWEKWSTFSNNRYVEEAEKFSRPGSVAQKKAFFEAHYKNMAARKAAALLEQANAAASNVSEPDNEGRDHDNTTHDPEIAKTDAQVAADKGVEVQVLAEPSATDGPQAGMERSETRAEEEFDISTKNQQVQVQKTLSGNALLDYKEVAKEIELSAKSQMEKPLLKEFASRSADSAPKTMSKKKPVISSSKPQVHGKASRLPSTPTKFAALLQARKEADATPISMKSTMDSRDKKKPTPKSTHKSMSFTPVREFNRITSTIIRKIDGSRLGSNSKPSKDCPTPSRTPTMVSFATPQHPLASQHSLATPRHPLATQHSLATPQHPLVTPQTEIGRAKTPLHPSASTSKTVRPKWHFLPTDCSKFMSGSRNKSPSPNICKPFSLRTEERAAKRKQKLEEKFNANQTQKLQQQATLKEKAETEMKKLRKTLCFKARPLPKFYKERVTPTAQVEKVPLTHSQSPELGSTPTPGKTSSIKATSNPPQRTSMKNNDSTNFKGKNCHNQRSLASRLKDENTSPNVQRQ